jgi:hypothetical protein
VKFARGFRNLGVLPSIGHKIRRNIFAGNSALPRTKGVPMAKLALVYGMRLFPSEELSEVGEATLTLKDGRTARITMHLIEGSKKEIEATLRQSVEAFFDMYPEI